eukprot:scaffold2019_cov34-Attheya_sp.AAC.1
MGHDLWRGSFKIVAPAVSMGNNSSYMLHYSAPHTFRCCPSSLRNQQMTSNIINKHFYLLTFPILSNPTTTRSLQMIFRGKGGLE